jgi:hypothetical protein
VGSTHKAHCNCGFEVEVTVGGSRSSFNSESFFPHYCENCGLVEADIAKAEAKGEVPPCPKCGSNDLHEYGTETVSESRYDNDVALQWGAYHAMEKGNLCPVCKKMTLIFDRMASILFD